MTKKAEDLDLLFHSILSRFFTVRTRQAASGAVTFAQMRLVWTIEQEGPLPLTRLASVLGVGPSTATELAERLVRGGFLRRETSREDRRSRLLSLTPRGKGMLGRFARLRQERFRRILRALSAAEVDRLARSLRTVDTLLGKCRDA
jgi:DNA-binding MarR family transcriptional regulator